LLLKEIVDDLGDVYLSFFGQGLNNNTPHLILDV
jgi:hypothetical protein